MSNSWGRDWLAWFILGTLLLGMASVMRLALDVGRPYGGYLEEYNPFWDGRLEVDSVTPVWWPNLSLVQSDRTALLAIENQPYWLNSGDLYLKAVGRQATSISLQMDQNGRIEEVNLPLVTFTWSNFLDIKLPSFIVGAGLWMLALALYQARPFEPLNRTAAFMFCTVASVMVVGYCGVFWVDGWLSFLLRLTVLVALPLMGAALLHFALVFPLPLIRHLPVLTFLVYSVGIGTAVVWVSSHTLVLIHNRPPYWVQLEQQSFVWATKYLITPGIFALTARIVVSWIWPYSKPVTRRQLAIMSLGALIASPALAIFVVDQWGGKAIYFLNGLDLRYAMLAIPLAFAFVILRYKAFQSSHPLFLAVTILTASALLASVGTWLVLRLQGQSPQPLSQTFAPMLGVTLLASSFWSTQSSWRGLFGRLLQWDQRSYREVGVFSEKIAGCLYLKQLPDQITQTLVQQLKVEVAAIWLWDAARSSLWLAGHSGTWKSAPPEELKISTCTLDALNHPIRPHAATGTEADWYGPLQQAGNADIAIRLAARESSLNVGLLVVGRRADEEIFDDRDVEVIELIAHECVLALLAAQELAERERAYRWAEQAEGRERTRIARDLHDTVQQFFSGLTYTLTANQAKVISAPDDVVLALKHCVAETQAADHELREIIKDLAAEQLKENLSVALQESASTFHQRTAIKVSLDAPATYGQMASPRAQLTIYRAIRQALDNVAAHAAATQVAIYLTETAERLEFSICDNGQGFSAEQRQYAEQNHHFGLRFMEERLRELGGAMAISSSPTAGTCIGGWLPLRV